MGIRAKNATKARNTWGKEKTQEQREDGGDEQRQHAGQEQEQRVDWDQKE